MNIKLLLILLFISYISFSQTTKFCDARINTDVGVPCNQEVEQPSQGDLTKLYTLNDSFPINDVRRYGVFPDKKIGMHPVTSTSKIQVVLDLAEAGLTSIFLAASITQNSLLTPEIIPIYILTMQRLLA